MIDMSPTTKIAVRKPFSFAQALRFCAGFPPCQGQTIVTADSLTVAMTVGGRGRAFTLRAAGAGGIALECAKHDRAELVRRAADFIATDDDLAPFYAAADADPAMRAIVRELHGLHHVRFLGLEEAALYSVLMQRNPPKVAGAYKLRFLAKLGKPVEAAGRTLFAMPALDELATLPADTIASAIGNRAKAERIAVVTRGVAALGERFLREAPYADVKRALLEIPGLGPFSSTAILLRGLGRMNELPTLAWFEREGRAAYGRAWNPDAIARRYGEQIGYWSFYLKASAGRARRATGTATTSPAS